jgi:hypothetical protein
LRLTEEILIDNCHIEHARQFVYGGSTTKTVKATIRNSTYIQGTHPGTRGNSALYLKGPGTWNIENTVINAPALLASAVTADGCHVNFSKDCKWTAPKLLRPFNSGTLTETIPLPIITKTTGEITIETTTTYEGVVTTKYFLPTGQELIIKP